MYRKCHVIILQSNKGEKGVQTQIKIQNLQRLNDWETCILDYSIHVVLRDVCDVLNRTYYNIHVDDLQILYIK